MADLEFNTTAGQTISRELMIAYLNTGTSAAPEWSAIGKRVEESDLELDWSQESIKDILGSTWTTMKKPIVTQTFDPMPLDSGDAATVKIWNLGIKDQDAQALANQDMVIAHFYASGSANASWAERYSGCAIAITRAGGEGGGNLTLGTEITYGGERTLGSVSKASDGTITFTANSGE